VKVKVPLASDPDQRRTFVASTLDDGVDSVDVMDALIG
jgi:hypothetical protein